MAGVVKEVVLSSRRGGRPMAEAHARGPHAHGGWSSLLVRATLLAVAAATPWFFGGVWASVQSIVYLAVLAALVCWLAGLVSRETARAGLPFALFPLVGGIALGVAQLIPIEAAASAALAPHGAKLRSELVPLDTAPGLEKLPPGLETGPRTPISLYPGSTRRDLAMLLLATCAFVLAARFFRQDRAFLWLSGILAANGAALAFFGIVQQLTWNGELYWRVPLTSGGVPFGPFVNRNNAGGQLNLCLAGALGLFVWATCRQRARGGPGYEEPVGDAPPPWDMALETASARPHPPILGRKFVLELWRWVVGFVANLNATKLAALSLVGCIVAGILCSLSRGTTVAMIGAAAVTLALAFVVQRRHSHAWLVATGAVVGLGLVAWVGKTEAVQARLATLFDERELADARLPHWRDGIKAVPDFWRLGSGLGTYRYVYELYEERPADVWFYHAENQYLEALVEGGVVGLGLLLAAIASVGAANWYLFRAGARTGDYAPAVVGTFALASQAVGGFFDFGLYLPANMIVLALVSGAVTGRAALVARQEAASSLQPPASSSMERFVRPRVAALSPLVALALTVAGVCGFFEVRSAAAVETALAEARRAEEPPARRRRDPAAPKAGLTDPPAARAANPPTAGSTGALEVKIGRLESALRGRWDDADAHRRLAGLWIRLYRLRALDELGGGEPSADPSLLWAMTSSAHLHRRASEFLERDMHSELERLRTHPAVVGCIKPAWKHLLLARQACPLVPEVHLALAEISLVVDGLSAAEEALHVDRARRLAPGDATLLFRCGVLDFQAGRTGRACASWRASLRLADRHEDQILRLATQRLAIDALVDQLFPPSPAFLVRIARQRYQGDLAAVERQVLLRRAAALLDPSEVAEDERYYLRGSIAALEGRLAEAVEEYGRAVELRADEVEWRYELALALRRQGRLEEAHQQARWCARMAPDHPGTRQLLHEIHQTRLRQ